MSDPRAYLQSQHALCTPEVPEVRVISPPSTMGTPSIGECKFARRPCRAVRQGNAQLAEAGLLGAISGDIRCLVVMSEYCIR